MGTKSHFLPVLPLSGDDIIAPAVLPMSSNGSTAGPGGLRPPLPQPRAQGKPDPVPHPGFWGIPPPNSFPFPLGLGFLTHAWLQPQLPAAHALSRCTSAGFIHLRTGATRRWKEKIIQYKGCSTAITILGKNCSIGRNRRQ